jgi:hypothetical protein
MTSPAARPIGARLLARLRRQVDLTADPVLVDLRAELQGGPDGGGPRPTGADPTGGIAVPFRLRVGKGVLSFLSTATVFGTPIEVTLAELTLESFFPADPATADAVRRLAAAAA